MKDAKIPIGWLIPIVGLILLLGWFLDQQGWRVSKLNPPGIELVPPTASVVPQSIQSNQSIVTPLLPTLTPLAWAIETSFIVQANQPWQNTGVEVRRGDSLEIVYSSGQWTGRSSSPGLSGPDFGPSPENTDECYPIRGEGSSLIGKIGNGEPFKIGYQYVGNPTDTGILLLRMNDCDKLLFDNAGSITVTIRIRR
ncbi:MAG: hypothetical protein ACP5UR_06535 [Chloroflexus sp.]|uniref:hypothetical protein n=1 Tax=Chloroflexus sp. TaxID=1904827 RepID=UPI003D0C5275